MRFSFVKLPSLFFYLYIRPTNKYHIADADFTIVSLSVLEKNIFRPRDRKPIKMENISFIICFILNNKTMMFDPTWSPVFDREFYKVVTFKGNNGVQK